MAVILLAGLQVGAWPVFLIWRIRIFLAFKAYADMLRIFDAVLASDSCALEIASVDLNTGLIGKHFEENAGLGRIERCTNLCIIAFSVFVCIQAPVVIVSGSIFNLLEV